MLPSVGEIFEGYRFLGGDPNDEKSWEKFDNRPREGDIIDGYRFLGGNPSKQESWQSKAEPRKPTFAEETEAAAAAGQEYWTGRKEEPKTTGFEYPAPTLPEEFMATAEPPSIIESLPPGEPVSARPLQMPARPFQPRENRVDALMLGAMADIAAEQPAPKPTRLGPTIEAARQLEQRNILDLAVNNADAIAAARDGIKTLLDEYPDLSEPKEQYPLTYSARSAGARFISNIGDALYKSAEAGERNILEPGIQTAIQPQVLTQFQNLASSLFPRDEEGKIKRLDLAERFEKKAKELQPSIQNVSFDDAWDGDRAGSWVLAKMAGSADSVLLAAATIVAPKLAPITLPIIATSSAGGAYAEARGKGVAPEIAALSADIAGAAEASFEFLDAIMFRGAGKALYNVTRKMSAAQKDAFAASLAGKALQGMAITTAAAAGGGTSEALTSIVQDLSKKYVAGLETGDMQRNAKEAFIIGAAMGPLFTAAGAIPSAVESAGAVRAERAAEESRAAALERWRTQGLTQGLAPAAPQAAPQIAPVAPAVTAERTLEQTRDAVISTGSVDEAIATSERITAEPVAPRAAQPSLFAQTEAANIELARRAALVEGVPFVEPTATTPAPPPAVTPAVEAAPVAEAAPPVAEVTSPAVPTAMVAEVVTEAAPQAAAPVTAPAPTAVVTPPPAPVAAPAIEAPTPPAATTAAPIDFAAPRSIPARGVVRGEVLTFPTEKQALAFAAEPANKVQRSFKPRETEDGWVLSKPPRTEAQIRAAASRAQAQKAVLDTDDLLTVIAKSGGLNFENLEREGFDAADLSSINKSRVRKPFRRGTGMTLDGLTEILASNDFDVLDREGNPDLDKVTELLQDSISGTPVYSFRGYEAVAAIEAEAQAKLQEQRFNEAAQQINEFQAEPEDVQLAAAFAFAENGDIPTDFIKPEGFSDEELARVAEQYGETGIPAEEAVTGAAVEGFEIREGGARIVPQAQENVNQAIARANESARAETNFSAAPIETKTTDSPANAIGGVRLVAGGLNNEMLQQGKVSLLGHSITSVKDLAEAAQIYRGPYEVFRAFFVDGTGKVIHQTGVSARLPNRTGIIPGNLREGNNTISRWFNSMVERTGAKGFYILHNHPSGDPTPSQADITSTKAIAQNQAFLGHVVIDTTDFVEIRKTGTPYRYKLKEQREDKLRNYIKQNGVIGGQILNSNQIATVGKMFEAKDMSVVIAYGNKIEAIGEVPNSVLMHPVRGPAAIRRFARFNAGADIFVYTSNQIKGSEQMFSLYQRGFVTDAVSPDGRSVVEVAGLSPRAGAFGEGRARLIRQGEQRAIQEPSAEALPVLSRARGGEAVGEGNAQREEAAREGRAGEAGAEEVTAWAKKTFGDRMAPNGNPVWENFVRWFGDSKAVDENGEPLVVYHGGGKDFSEFKYEQQGSNFEAFEGAFPREGFWFTSNPSNAYWYSGMAARDTGGEGQVIYPVYLALKNPFVYTAQQFVDEGEAGIPSQYELERGGYDGMIVNVARYPETSAAAKAMWQENTPKYGAPYAWPKNIKAEYDKLLDQQPEQLYTHYVAFRPEQIKSAVGNNGDFGQEPSIIKQRPTPYLATPWFSELARQVDKGHASMPAAQWKGWLANRPGIKKDELYWSGINEWLDLQQGKVTKEQVSEYLQNNGVSVKERVLSERAVRKEVRQDAEGNYWLPTADGGEINIGPNADPMVINLGLSEAPKFGQHTLPGGTNYREVLLTLPGTELYRSTHWADPNVIVHFRIKDRTDANGKKVLFVEEIQSDWGQTGKKKGFRLTPSQIRDLRPGSAEAIAAIARGDLGVMRQVVDDGFGRQVTMEISPAKQPEGIVPAPFVTSTDAWVNLALKRILTMAYQGEYDAVAFVNGEQSADRYDLSKQVDYIDYIQEGKDKYRIAVVGKDGQGVNLPKETFTAAELENYVGKEVAQKIINGEGQVGGGRKTIRGQDLKVGGEGMKAFYDKIVPAALNKLLSKLDGGKVGTVSLPIDQREYGQRNLEVNRFRQQMLDKYGDGIMLKMSKEELAQLRALEDGRSNQPGFYINENLKDNVSEGLALFQPQTPYGGNQASVDAPSPSRIDNIIRLLQDKNIDLKRVIDRIKAAGTKLNDAFDPYLQEGLAVSRMAAADADFKNNELNPLLEEVGKQGIKLVELEEYLHARHAPSRNREMAKRNPTQEELDAKLREIDAAIKNGVPGSPQLEQLYKEKRAWQMVKPWKGTEEERQSLSGMSTEAANKYLAELSPDKKAKLEALAEQVDGIIAKTRNILAQGGVDSSDSFNDSWEHYVPLHREGKEDGGFGYGQGYSIKGKSTRTATGSTRKVVDIIANIAAARDQAITRVEKNRVANAMIGLAMTNPDPSLWRIDVAPQTAMLDKTTGKVVMRPDPNYKNDENVIVARMPDGKGGIVEHAVVFNPESETAMRIVASLKGLDTKEIEGLLAVNARVTRFIASMNTQYNPVFGVVNLVRDLQSSAINIQDTPIAGKQGQLISEATKALGEIFMELRAQRKGQTRDTEYSRLFEEFRREGGQTGFREGWVLSGDKTKQMETMVNRAMATGLKRTGYQAMNAVGSITKDLLSDYNSTLENAIRVAAYKLAKEQGLSKARSAMVAKDVTVNFNRKGSLSNQIGAGYAFFNAAVQGTERLGRVLDIRISPSGIPTMGPRGIKIVTGGVLIGVAQAFALAAAGIDDDEIPDFIKEKNLIIPLGLLNKTGMFSKETLDKGYVTIPMPLGLHVLPNLGRLATESALNGFKDPGKKAAKMLAVTVDAFNPIGTAAGWQTLAPTTLDPIVALLENKDWTGKPIYRENFDQLGSVPGFERARDNPSYIGMAIAKGLNKLSGGTEFSSGLISPTPEAIEYLIGQATGGPGREITKTQKMFSAMGTGEEIPPSNIPLLSRFYGEVRNQTAQGQKFYDNIKVLLRHGREITGIENMEEEIGKDDVKDRIDAYIEKNPEAEIWDEGRRAMREVQQLRKAKREAIKENASKDEIKDFDLQITEYMAEFNARVKELRQ